MQLGTTKFRQTGNGAIILSLCVLLLATLIVAVICFTFTYNESRRNIQWSQASNELRGSLLNLRRESPKLLRGEKVGFETVQRDSAQFQHQIDQLQANQAGGIETYVSEAHLQTIEPTWQRVKISLTQLVKVYPTVQSLNARWLQAKPTLIDLLDQSRTLQQNLRAAYAPSAQMFSSAKAVENAVGLMYLFNQHSMGLSQAKDISQEMALRTQALSNLLSEQFPPEQSKQVDSIRELLTRWQKDAIAIEPAQAEYAKAFLALETLQSDMLDLSATLTGIGKSANGDRVEEIFRFGIIAAIFSGFLLLALFYAFWLEARHRLGQTEDQNRRNQRAILRLLDEMGELADGNLTTHATVSEDITGAIADSVNYAIDQLRKLVMTINRTAGQVSSAATRTRSTADALVEASAQQTREISAASSSINNLVTSMTEMSGDAGSSAKVALNSVTTASKGAEAVRQTISGMDTIREQIQETSKRIKRLGESSQEIGDIIGLINDIADRTNILALNAAIQASTAGEAGRGFARVADEVQQLAERVGDATRRIEVLVSTIQSDTYEAISSMEQSTAGVVQGARLAENAGGALNEIETVSRDIATQAKKISQSADHQVTVTTTLSRNMNVIREITQHNAKGTRETAASISMLNGLSEELRGTVRPFKLPTESEYSQYGASEEDLEFDNTVLLGKNQ